MIDEHNNNVPCSECHRPIAWTVRKRDKPMICGPCLQRIGETAKWAAIHAAQREERRNA